MSAAPISAAEAALAPHTRAALERAGWPVDAWRWEQAVLAGLEELTKGERASARRRFQAAQSLAEDALPPDDLRRITAAANLAILDQDRVRLTSLAARWQASAHWLATLQPHARSRSSLFHLRLESKHRGGYNHLHITRMKRLWSEGHLLLTATCAASEPIEDLRASAQELQGHWTHMARRLGFVDERKLAAAAGLLLPGRTAR